MRIKFIQPLDTEILNPNDLINYIFSLQSVKPLDWPFQQYFDPQSLTIIKWPGGSFFSKLKNDLTLNSAQNSVIHQTFHRPKFLSSSRKSCMLQDQILLSEFFY